MVDTINHGASWSEAEDTQLIKAFDSGVSVLDIAKTHGRSDNAIRLRLEKLGKLPVRESTGDVASSKKRPSRWTNDEEASLIKKIAMGVPIAEIAEAHGRSTGAIRSRLSRMNIDVEGEIDTDTDWSEAEENQLIEAYDSGITVSDIADSHGRSQKAIRFRLNMLGKVPSEEETGSAGLTQQRSSPWTAIEEIELIGEFAQGIPIVDIAEAHKCSVEEINTWLDDIIGVNEYKEYEQKSPLQDENDGVTKNVKGDVVESSDSSPNFIFGASSFEFGTNIDFSKPTITNTAAGVLNAWTALEVLVPQGFTKAEELAFGRKKDLIDFRTTEGPYFTGEKAPKGKRLSYELILGAIDIGAAVTDLVGIYSDNRPEVPKEKSYSPIASIMINSEGSFYNDEDSVSISSFAWGLPIALKGELTKLADWTFEEKNIKKHILNFIFDERIYEDENGNAHQYEEDWGDEKTDVSISELFNCLTFRLGLHEDHVITPYFAIRRYDFAGNKKAPTANLLNSFYLKDLALASELADTDRLPKSLKHYLGVAKPKHKVDLLKDNSALSDLLNPKATPLGRWPAPGRFPLALLQQAAVNVTKNHMAETGIVAVNGPPGTGKTTLLRDVIAARIVERAKSMVQFQNPADAFVSSNEKLKRDGAFLTPFHLDETLKGFEMVVASSNNKAVENVSAELPSLDAIAEDAKTLRYFSSVSDELMGQETWGAISAVLGNSTNRYKFKEGFWSDPEHGFLTYLKHSSVVAQVVTDTKEDGSPIKRLRKVVSLENPPSNPQEALKRWQEATLKFNKACARIEKKYSDRQKIYEVLTKSYDLIAEKERLQEYQPINEVQYDENGYEIASTEQSEFSTIDKLPGLKEKILAHKLDKPNLSPRALLSEEYRLWKDENKRIKQEIKNDKEIKKLNKKIAKIEERALAMGKKMDITIPTSAFFQQSNAKRQQSNLWFDAQDGRDRDEVFELAMGVHKSFIDAASDPIRHNMTLLMESFGTRSFGSDGVDALIPDLWQSLFLIVPCISTTFASINGMFSKLPPESIGWLLVDEAGQAIPQAAVGAIMRSKNTVAVGDPLQIEPVVTLSNSLTKEICEHFGVDPDKFNAPDGSVQTLSDAASAFCTRFPGENGYRDVGMPLLVHRRCNSPMFEISNEVAYANFMVNAKPPSSSIGPLGPSCWFDVVGNADADKWCESEGVELIEKLHILRSSSADADVYIVTPFKAVQDKLRNRVLNSGVLQDWVDNPKDWVNERVGTVHTVQGRESHTVFFVLGSQGQSQGGARQWAGGSPNLVNVAVTRAKSYFYVIGNRALWKDSGVFKVLDRLLATEHNHS